MSTVAQNLALVREKIADAAARAGRSVSEVRLVAVSKKQPIERVQAAYDAGQREFGENYVQELERRKNDLPPDARFHMIGHLQTNKAKRALAAAMIHTVDSERLARALEAGRSIEILIELNLGGEETKTGVSPEGLEALAIAIRAQPNLHLRGLMCIPPPGDTRPYFARLREERDKLAARIGAPLPELSMGMSDDYEAAILEGSTMVRVGTAIFGART